MKQTAVDFIVKQLDCLTRERKDKLISAETFFNHKINLIKQAKEMEKEQIVEAGNSCALKQHLHNDRINKMSESEIRQFAEQDCLTFGEEYYKETFKNK